jgi:hypothetical protein
MLGAAAAWGYSTAMNSLNKTPRPLGTVALIFCVQASSMNNTPNSNTLNHVKEISPI